MLPMPPIERLVEQRPLDPGAPAAQRGGERGQRRRRGPAGRGRCARSRPGPPSPASGSTDSPPNVRWSTKRSSRPPSVNANRARRCVPSGASGGSTSSWPLMPEVGRAGPRRAVARPAAATGTCRAGSAAVSVRPVSRGDEVVGAGQVPPDGPRVLHLDRGDGPADDPLLQAAADHLDLGQLRHGDHGSGTVPGGRSCGHGVRGEPADAGAPPTSSSTSCPISTRCSAGCRPRWRSRTPDPIGCTSRATPAATTTPPTGCSGPRRTSCGWSGAARDRTTPAGRRCTTRATTPARSTCTCRSSARSRRRTGAPPPTGRARACRRRSSGWRRRSPAGSR